MRMTMTPTEWIRKSYHRVIGYRPVVLHRNKRTGETTYRPVSFIIDPEACSWCNAAPTWIGVTPDWYKLACDKHRRRLIGYVFKLVDVA